jgi:nitrogen fixation protein FixH
MRVRPLFWCILALSCISVLILAATVRTHASAIMQVRLEQPIPGSVGFTTLKLHLADTQGLPIDQAQVIPRAWMTNMDMETHQVTVKALGGGNYQAQLRLYMVGPWKIDLVAHADDFDPLEQTLLVQVE